MHQLHSICYQKPPLMFKIRINPKSCNIQKEKNTHYCKTNTIVLNKTFFNF